MHLFPPLGEIIEAPGLEQARIARMLGLPGDVSRRDFTNLFVIQLFPYASIYLSPDGLAGGAVRDRIGEYWKILGWPAPAEPDHASSLLKSYGTLHPAYRGEYISSDVAQQSRPFFFWDAVASWMPMYLLRVQEIGSELYRTWATVTSDVIEAEAAQHGAPEVLPVYLRNAPLPPSIDNPAEFVDALFAPVMSGVILTRSDLGRCAAANGLTVRMADRRHTLKLLISEKPRGVCPWLRGEIARQTEKIEQMANVLAPVRDHWSERARAFAALMHKFEERYSRPDQIGKLL